MKHNSISDEGGSIGYAVANRRHDRDNKIDLFPTPPWATRALLQFIDVSCCIVREPACGLGHMARVLTEYGASVQSSDVVDYGHGDVFDYLETPCDAVDWVITNPPFSLAEQFINKAISETRIGVAMLVRTSFIEGAKRHERLFTKHPPYALYQFVERVPMFKGRVDPKGSSATAYCWMVWEKGYTGNTNLFWIPPCRKRLEKAEDYE